MGDPASKSELDRHGATLRDWSRSPELGDPQRVDDALRALREYRQRFAYPLTKVSANLRYYAPETAGRPLITQRLKRAPQIISKLVRFPTTRLTQVEDIGGCRAVVHDLPGVTALADRLQGAWTLHREPRDYLTFPKETGYRGYHLVVLRDGRPIEVQIRTLRQQAWADAVETLADRFSLPLKDGGGPPELTRWLRLAAERIRRTEEGLPSSEGLSRELDHALAEALAWMEAQQ